jgi:hypothetical protein
MGPVLSKLLVSAVRVSPTRTVPVMLTVPVSKSFKSSSSSVMVLLVVRLLRTRTSSGTTALRASSV